MHSPTKIPSSASRMAALMGRVAVHVGVGDLGIRLFNLDLNGSGVGGVAHRIHRHIGEGVLASLVFIGSVDKFAAAVLRHGHRPAGGLVEDMIREQIPLGVYGGKLGRHRHIFVGGELQVFPPTGAPFASASR